MFAAGSRLREAGPRARPRAGSEAGSRWPEAAPWARRPEGGSEAGSRWREAAPSEWPTERQDSQPAQSHQEPRGFAECPALRPGPDRGGVAGHAAPALPMRPLRAIACPAAAGLPACLEESKVPWPPGVERSTEPRAERTGPWPAESRQAGSRRSVAAREPRWAAASGLLAGRWLSGAPAEKLWPPADVARAGPSGPRARCPAASPPANPVGSPEARRPPESGAEGLRRADRSRLNGRRRDGVRRSRPAGRQWDHGAARRRAVARRVLRRPRRPSGSLRPGRAVAHAAAAGPRDRCRPARHARAHSAEPGP